MTGFTSGRETNKGSRLLGKIGALITDFNGKRLELSGLTDTEAGRVRRPTGGQVRREQPRQGHAVMG